MLKEGASTLRQIVWGEEPKSIRSWDLSLHLSGGRRGKKEVGHCLLSRVRSEMLEG